MSHAYILFFPEEDAQPINSDALQTMLADRWNYVEFNDAVDSTHTLAWTTYLEKRILGGWVQKGGTAISLEGYLEDAAEFVVWYRATIPIERRLMLVDTSYSFGELEITPALSETGIIQHIIENSE
ncbi:MAG: hypothetical protein AAFV33_06140 [Chloroflexota bacterium]